MWTVDKFLAEVKPGEVFCLVVETVTFMTGKPLELLFVAKRGEIDDWALYCTRIFPGDIIDNAVDRCCKSGDKVTDTNNIKHIVNCNDHMINHYRY